MIKYDENKKTKLIFINYNIRIFKNSQKLHI